MLKWLPIDTYPPCETCGKPGCDWGPETLLLMPIVKSHVVSKGSSHLSLVWGQAAYVGHKEAGMWLVRDAEDPVCWSELHTPPTHWAPLPEVME